MKLNEHKACILDALAYHGVIASLGAIETAAVALMIAEADYRWSLALWDRPEYADLRLAATRARREAIDAAAEPLFT